MKFNKPGNASVLEERCTESMGRNTREDFTVNPIVLSTSKTREPEIWFGGGCWVTCNNKEDIVDFGVRLLLLVLYIVLR